MFSCKGVGVLAVVPCAFAALSAAAEHQTIGCSRCFLRATPALYSRARDASRARLCSSSLAERGAAEEGESVSALLTSTFRPSGEEERERSLDFERAVGVLGQSPGASVGSSSASSSSGDSPSPSER